MVARLEHGLYWIIMKWRQKCGCSKWNMRKQVDSSASSCHRLGSERERDTIPNSAVP
jgi:hypothetical protein